MENIHVTVRVRPLSDQEVRNEEETLWGISQSHNLYIHQQYIKELTNSKKLPTGMRSQFTFDQCYSGRDSNQEIYNSNIQSIVLGSLNGINGTVFVYGQTGSGKTYTMLGPNSTHSDQGILFRSLTELFEKINQDLDKTYVLRCSYFEIYNEQIFDLLTSEGIPEVLQVNEDGRKEFFIRGLTEESVSTATEVLQVVKRGETNRHYAYTQMNHHSSRSHTIFRLTIQSITNKFIRNYRREQSQLKFQSVEQLTPKSDSENNNQQQSLQGALITESVLNFIDLAGSEKVSNHGSQIEESLMYESRIDDQSNKTRVKEGQYINKSLFFLTQVIYLKAEGKTHVPYRNSSLTKILRSSLGGNSRTFIMLCINPTISHFDHTLSTLRFGMSAKKIENRIHANIQSHDDDEAIKIIISEYEKKIRDLEKARQVDLEMLRVASERLNIIQDHSKKLQDRLTKKNKLELNKIVFPDVEKYRISECIKDVGEIILPIQYQTFKQNTQQTIKHDCQGALALLSFKKQKKRSQQLLNIAHQMISNYKLIRLQANQEHIKTIKLEQELKSTQNCMRNLDRIFQNLQEQSLEMAYKLDLNDLTNISNQQLTELKLFYEVGLKQLEKEEWRREILKEINQSCSEQCQFKEILQAKYKKQIKFEPYLNFLEKIQENKFSISEISYQNQNYDSNSYINTLDQIFFTEIDRNWEDEDVLSYEELQEQLKNDTTQQKSELKIIEDININRFSSIPHSDLSITRQPSLREQLNQINLGGLQNIFSNENDLPRSFTQKLLDFINDQDIQPSNNDISHISRIQEESQLSCDIPETSMLQTTNSVTTISKARQHQTPEYRFRKPLGGNEIILGSNSNITKHIRTPNTSTNEKKKQSSSDKNKIPNVRKSMCSTSSTKIQKIIQTSVSNKKSNSKKDSQINLVKNTNRKNIQDENNSQISLLSMEQSNPYPNNQDTNRFEGNEKSQRVFHKKQTSSQGQIFTNMFNMTMEKII